MEVYSLEKFKFKFKTIKRVREFYMNKSKMYLVKFRLMFSPNESLQLGVFIKCFEEK